MTPRTPRRAPRMLFSGCTALVLGLVLAMAVVAPALSASLKSRHVRSKPSHSQLWPGLRSDLLIVKFAEGSEVRLEQGLLRSRTGQDLSGVEAVLVARADVVVERLFSRSEAALDLERVEAQSISGQALADLNNYYKLLLPNGSVRDAEELIDALNALPIVEIAYAEPIAQNAWISQDELLRQRRELGLDPVHGVPVDDVEALREAERVVRDAQAWEQVITGETSLPGRLQASGSFTPSTPNYEPMQDYIEPAPLGVNAPAAWAFAGGNGAGVKIIDVEIGWNWNHEDIPAPFYTGGPVQYDDHGVAVTGEMVAKSNGFGVTGIAHGAQIGGHSVLGTPTADVFNQVQSVLSAGDIFIIELHCPGPGATGGGQDGFIALEWWQANFDAIATATARGVQCCEAAGNGAEDFDNAMYLGLFDRNVRDSGAIIVGAAVGSSRAPESYTNYGARVDLHGWGSLVTTTGYGSLQGGSQNQWYTADFSGTSSATPIVTGSVAALQGAYKAATGGAVLPNGTIMEILRSTGTAQTGTKHIGPRPNLAAAIPMALSQLGTVSGVVTESGSGTPLEGAEVRITETGARTATLADGSYSILATAGDWTVRATHFGHITSSTTVTVPAGGVVTEDYSLVLQPTAALTGRVLDTNGSGVANATVSILGTPIVATITDALGLYSFPTVPSNLNGIVEAQATGMTPDRRAFTMGLFGTQRDLRVAAPIDFEASNGGFTLNSGQWAWGIPTYVGGPTAHSGSKLWGTNLTGPYNVSQSHRLYSPVFDLTGVLDPRLAFWHWFSIWGPYDGGNVSISTNGGTSWTVIQPVGDYDDACIDAFPQTPCAPGYTNSSNGWVPAVFDLTAYVDKQVRFRFWLQPWGYEDAAGWYIDDVQVHGAAPVGVPEGSRVASLFAAEPNPTRGTTTLRFSLVSAAEIDLGVYTIDGRLIRTLASGTRREGIQFIEWDGQDERGRSVPPGVYFARLGIRDTPRAIQRAETERIVIVR